jgi:hypothetical protein
MPNMSTLSPAPGLGPASAVGVLPRLFNRRDRHPEPTCHWGSVHEAECQPAAPIRRSADGQMILTGGLPGWESMSDLLLCGAPLRGAPLRNRTVDLLLTMDLHDAPVTAPGTLTSADTGCREQEQARASPR